MARSNFFPIHRPLLSWSFLVLCLVFVSASQAQVLSDGPNPANPNVNSTLGTVVNTVGDISNISGGTRPKGGQNLFHSFGQFDVPEGHTAMFLSETQALGDSTTNIFSRITNENPSSIFGSVDTATNFPNSNLWLMGTAFIFGPQAELNVAGTFAATTANTLLFEDGRLFSVVPDTNTDGLLSVSKVVAMEFMGTDRPVIAAGSEAAIKVEGLNANGAEVMLVGRDSEAGAGGGLVPGIAVSGAVQNFGSKVVLASVADEGHAPIGPGGEISLFKDNDAGQPVLIDPMTQTPVTAELGKIAMTSGAQVNVSGNGGGTVVIRGGQLMVDNARVLAENVGDMPATSKGIDVQVTKKVLLTNNSFVTTDVLGDGDAGHISIRAGRVAVQSSSVLRSFANFGSGGDSGHIFIKADTLDVVDQGDVNGFSGGAGNGGSIDLVVGKLTLAGGGRLGTTTFGGRTGDAGTITIRAGEVSLDSGQIRSDTFVDGNAGAIDLNVNKLSLSGGAQIFTNAFVGSTGKAGPITIHGLDGLDGPGTTAESLSISGTSTGLFTATSSVGLAGAITLDTESLTLESGARLDSSARSGSGNAGAIDLNVNNLTLSGGAQIFTNSSSRSTGQAGPLTVRASGPISLSGTGTNLSTTSNLGVGGTVDLQAGQLEVRGEARIDASGEGGGTITVRGDQVTVDHAKLLATTQGDLDGEPTGIDIEVTGQVLITGDAEITTDTKGEGDGGAIRVKANHLELGSLQSGWFPMLGSRALSGSEGNAGKVTLTAITVEVPRGRISTTAEFGSSGQAGMLRVDAFDSLNMSVGRLLAGGKGGQIDVLAPTVEMTSGRIVAGNFEFSGNTSGGTVNIESTRLLLNGGGSKIDAGPEGSLSIMAKDAMNISGTLTSSSGSNKNGGTIVLSSPTVNLDQGTIQATSSFGTGGEIQIDVDHLTGNKGNILASSHREAGGRITINATDTGDMKGSVEFVGSSLGVWSDHGNGGQITINAPTVSIQGFATLNAKGETPGAIVLTGESLTVDGAEISADATGIGTGSPSGIDVQMTGPVLLTNEASLTAGVAGDGAGANIQITANSLEVNDAMVGTRATAGIGQAGDITIKAPTVRVTENGTIESRTGTNSLGQAGQVAIEADTLLELNERGSVRSEAEGASQAGTVRLKVGRLVLTEGQVSTSALEGSTRDAGTVEVLATESVTVGSDGPMEGGLFARALGSGNGGRLAIDTPKLEVGLGGRLSVQALGGGQAGTIEFDLNALRLTGGAIDGLTQGELILDGSLGSSGALAGPDFQIGSDLGMIQGGNLFHSFSRFNLRVKETATFSGPETITNIVTRVTGGDPVEITGTLRSDIPGVNLYFLAPNGLFVGPEGRFEFGGANNVSTATSLRFDDGARWFSNVVGPEGLSGGEPVAFGYGGGQVPASLVVQGNALALSEGLLPEAEGRVVSLVGGERVVVGRTVPAPAGLIQVASVASAGEVRPSVSEEGPKLGVDSFAMLGAVTLGEDGTLDVSGHGAGTVVIRSGDLLLDGGRLHADANGSAANAPVAIDLDLSGTLLMTGGALATADVRGTTDAGTVKVIADHIEMTDGSALGSQALPDSSADAGDLMVQTRTLLLEDADLESFSSSSFNSRTRTFGSAASQGNAGTIDITATDSAVIGNQANVRANSSRTDAGTIRITSPHLMITGKLNTDAGCSKGCSDANGGTIRLNVDGILNVDGGTISSRNTFSREARTGKGGEIHIVANESARLSGSFFTVANLSPGDAGFVKIDTSGLELTDEARIRTGGSDGANAGDVILTVDRLSVTAGASINTKSDIGDNPIARSGAIRIKATDMVQVSSGGRLDTGGANGIVEISGDAVAVEVTDSGLISAEVTDPRGSGEISLDVASLTLADGGLIDLNAKFEGEGKPTELTIIANEGVEIRGQTSTISSTGREEASAGLLSITTPLMRMDGGSIEMNTDGSGQAGTLALKVDQLTMTDGAQIDATTTAGGDAGNIVLEVGTLTATQGARLSSSSTSMATGAAGSVIIQGLASQADLVTLTNSSVKTSVEGDGAGGSIAVDATTVTLTDTDISASVNEIPAGAASDTGLAEIALTAPTVTISGGTVTAETTGSRDAGRVVLNVDTFTADQTTISSSSTGTATGDAGDLVMQGFDGLGTVPTEVTITDSTLSTVAEHTGGGGSITLGASGSNTLTLNNTAVTATVNDFAAASGETAESGLANILVTSPTIHIEGSAITTQSLGTRNAGAVEINAGNILNLRGNSTVSAAADFAQAGTIFLDAGHLLFIQDSTVTSSVLGGPGTVGGDIFIGSNSNPAFVVFQNSTIATTAVFGDGGMISIDGQVVLSDPFTTIDVSSQFGTGGTVTVSSPIQNLSGAIAPLPEDIVDVAQLVGQHCAAQQGGQLSSFVEAIRDVVPPGPADYLTSPLFLDSPQMGNFQGMNKGTTNLATQQLGMTLDAGLVTWLRAFDGAHLTASRKCYLTAMKKP